jgi:hypothetical protein
LTKTGRPKSGTDEEIGRCIVHTENTVSRRIAAWSLLAVARAASLCDILTHVLH